MNKAAKDANVKGKKKTKTQKGVVLSSMNELVSIEDVDIIDLADIAAVEEEVRSGKFTEVKLKFSLNDESDDSCTDE